MPRFRARRPSLTRPDVRVAGWVVVAVAAGVGLVSAQAVVAALAAVGAVVGGTCALMYEQAAHDAGRSRRSRTDATVAASLLGPTAVFAVAGLVELAGPAALLIVLVLLAGAAWLRHRPAGVEPVAPAVDPATLSDAELTLAWQNSHAELARSRDPVELARVSALRRDLLDDMECRDPAGFRDLLGGAAWVKGDSTFPGG